MKLAPTDQKLRGGYYTPQPIAHFLCEWAIRKDTGSVLEPSCGDGNILSEMAGVLAGLDRSGAAISDMFMGIEFD